MHFCWVFQKQPQPGANQAGTEGEPEVKPEEPYRRMLPGLVAKTRETLESEDTPITPRKRLMNFKIPLVNRGTQRGDAVIVSRRRLYEEENDSNLRKGRRKRRRSRDRSPKSHDQHKQQYLKNHLHVAVLSDISSSELYSDEEKRETKKVRKVRFKNPHRLEHTCTCTCIYMYNVLCVCVCVCVNSFYFFQGTKGGSTDSSN